MKTLFFTEDELNAPGVIIARERLAGAWIFGCGVIGGIIRDFLREREIGVTGFVDNNPELIGKSMNGLPVISPAAYAAKETGTPLILALSQGMREVRRQCADLGIANTFSYWEAMKSLGAIPFAKTMSPREIENSADARRGYELWEDAASRDKYRRCLRFLATLDESEVPAREADQYFSRRYVPAKHLRDFVDVGAYHGDTLAAFLAATGNDFSAYYGFEANPAIYEQLRQAAPADDSRINLYDFAAGAAAGETRLAAFGGGMSLLAASGGISVRSDRLDNILSGRAVSMIKMDIEGSEPQALAGAEGIIRAERPLLAISIYHQADHFWRIPLWIQGLNLNYAFSLGFHGRQYGEAICYARPL